MGPRLSRTIRAGPVADVLPHGRRIDSRIQDCFGCHFRKVERFDEFSGRRGARIYNFWQVFESRIPNPVQELSRFEPLAKLPGKNRPVKLKKSKGFMEVLEWRVLSQQAPCCYGTSPLISRQHPSASCFAA